jgi:hypothetical protein
MSRRRDDDSLDELVSDLSTTLSELQDVLDDEGEPHRSQRQQPRQRRSRRGLPSPSRFLRFTEEHTIPTLISLLETNIRALELFGGLLRLINGRDDRQRSGNRRVQRTGRRTLDAVDSTLSDIQGAIDGEPTDPEASSLLDDARSLREDINDRLADPGTTRDRTQSDHPDNAGRTDPRENEAISIDVTEEKADEDSGNGEQNQNSDEVNVDDELETIKQELQDDDDPSEGDE